MRHFHVLSCSQGLHTSLVSPDFWVGGAEVQEKGLEVALSQSEHGWDPDTKYSGLRGETASASALMSTES